MAATFGNATSAQSTAAGAISVSHTATTGSNTAALIGVGSSAGAGGALTSSVTYGGVDCGAADWDFVAQTFFHNSGHHKVNPLTGARTVTANLAANQDELYIQAFSMTDVDQATPVGTPVTNNGTGTTPTVTAAGAVGDLIVDCMYCDDPAGGAAGAGQTMPPQAQQLNINANISGQGSWEAGAASVVMSWTIVSHSWFIGAIAFKAAATVSGSIVSPSVPSRRMVSWTRAVS